MRRLIVAALLCTGVTPGITLAQAPATSPADYVLVTVILKHDQSRNLDEITQLLEQQGFWAKFPPDGIVVESWYVMMGLGCGISSWGGRCLSLADYVRGPKATRGTTAAAAC